MVTQHRKRFQTIIPILLLVGIFSIAVRPISNLAQSHQSETIRLLFAGDPFAVAIQSARETFANDYALDLEIEIVSYTDARTLILRNAVDLRSSYDLVSFDVLWLEDLVLAHALLPLDDWIAQADTLNVDDFLPSAYEGSRLGAEQYGLPVQPHPELLWYRRDLFEAAGIAPPVTTDDVLAAARQLHDPDNGIVGICWNGQRQQALGQQMAHFYGAFGQPLIDENRQPTLNTPNGVAAAQYALDLLEVSPPDILVMAWDQRIRRFSFGGCAMTYGWAARTYLVDNSEASTLHGQIGYLPAPHAPLAEPVTPIGTWSLGIPSNIGDRESIAWNALAALSSPAGQVALAEYGNGGMPRLSIMRDTTFHERYPAFPVVDQLNTAGQLQDWMRPALPEWTALEVILGEVYHDMLRGELTPQQAAAAVQAQAETLFQ